MSRTLRCYKQQQHSKLLAQFVFKMSTFCLSTCTKTRVPLPDRCINNSSSLRIRERSSLTSLIHPLH